MNLAARIVVRADRDTDVTMDVIEDDLVEEARASQAYSALAPGPTKRVDPAQYREAQEEARLAGRVVADEPLT